MTVLQEMQEIPTGRVSPTGWINLKTGSYADPNMLLGADGKPLTNINFYQAHLAAQKLGLRLTDDIEFNDLVNSNPDAAKQMRNYAVWTSLFKDVESEAKTGGYTAKHIARPEVSRKGEIYVVGGTEKAIRLPKGGFFKIKELLESDTGLPEKTYGGNMLDEPCAYWMANEGAERPVLRGIWSLYGPGQFNALAYWGHSVSGPGIGARVASDSEPNSIMIATAETVEAVKEISGRYGLKPAEVVAALGSRFSNK